MKKFSLILSALLFLGVSGQIAWASMDNQPVSCTYPNGYTAHDNCIAHCTADSVCVLRQDLCSYCVKKKHGSFLTRQTVPAHTAMDQPCCKHGQTNYPNRTKNHTKSPSSRPTNSFPG